jgi:hypothetical protein
MKTPTFSHFPPGFRTHRTACLLVTVSLLLLAAGTSAKAQSTWTGAGTDDLWTTAANWNPSGSPAAGAAIRFDGSTGLQLNNTLGTTRTIGSLTFTADQTAAVTINTVVGTPLTFSPGTVISVAAGSHQFVGTGVGTSGSSRDMVFAGTTGNTFVFDIASEASFEIRGRLGNSGTSSTNRNFEKTGAGTLILAGNSGGSSAWQHNLGTGFKIQNGILRFANGNAGGNSANNYIVSSGAALELSGGFTQTVSNGTYTLNGTGIGATGALRSISGNNLITAVNTATGSIALNSASTIGVDAGTLTLKKVISGPGSLTKVGAGTLVMGNTYSDNSTPFINTYTGATNVDEGTLIVDGTTDASSAVTVSNSGTALVVNGTINGTLTANASTTIRGTGTVAGAAAVSGNLNPGSSPGVLGFGSSLALAGTSVTTMEIAATGMVRGTDYDGINVGTSLGLDGDLLLDFGSIFANGTYIFDLFAVTGSTSGGFDSVALTGAYGSHPLSFGGGVWETSTNSGNETWSFSQATGDLTLTVIPEPRAALLGGLGLLALLRRRRK